MMHMISLGDALFYLRAQSDRTDQLKNGLGRALAMIAKDKAQIAGLKARIDELERQNVKLKAENDYLLYRDHLNS